MNFSILSIVFFITLIFLTSKDLYLAKAVKKNFTIPSVEEKMFVLINENLAVNGNRDEISISYEKKLKTGESNKDVKFYVYPYPNNPDYFKEVFIGNLNSLKESGLVMGTKIHMVTHGFTRSIEGKVTDVKNAYLRENFKNIVLVDWSKLSTPTPNKLPMSLLFYPQAKNNTIVVGQTVAEFIRFCKNNSYGEYDDFHLIGHSLGSHVMGIAGYTINKNTGGKVGRITGLDPAGPLYDVTSKNVKLSKDDARFVDAIHTDTDAYGTPYSVGTADFYANGGLGASQPQCAGEMCLLEGISCSHNTAYTYFINSIQRQKYYGCKCKKSTDSNTPCPEPSRCPSPVLFGEFSSENIEGNYYLAVN